MPSYSESFGLVGLEAQACGCPVIASNVAGLASVVRDGVTGFLVDGDEPELYASALGRLLDDRSLAAQMGRKGVLLAQRFTWQRTAGRLLAAFERLGAGQVGVQASARTE
jgi:D-inositol-3-phosphate glycosyltransferase